MKKVVFQVEILPIIKLISCMLVHAFFAGIMLAVFLCYGRLPIDVYKRQDQKGPEGETVAVAYAKQLPAKDCHTIERYTRSFNYPDKMCIRDSRKRMLPGAVSWEAPLRREVLPFQRGSVSWTDKA